MIIEICELGYCPYADDNELTCDDCPHWVSCSVDEFESGTS